MIKIVLKTTFLFFFINCYSQNDLKIIGIVNSEINKIPLEFSYVKIKSKFKSVITNEKGEFELLINKIEKDSLINIEISNIGYETLDTIIELKKINFNAIIFTLKSRFGINRQKALGDIKNNEVNILESGGIAPVLYKQDRKFAKKFNVNFIEYGCQAVAFEGIEEYNKTVFEYLDKAYGKKWRKIIRKNIIGYSEK